MPSRELIVKAKQIDCWFGRGVVVRADVQHGKGRRNVDVQVSRADLVVLGALITAFYGASESYGHMMWHYDRWAEGRMTPGHERFDTAYGKFPCPQCPVLVTGEPEMIGRVLEAFRTGDEMRAGDRLTSEPRTVKDGLHVR